MSRKFYDTEEIIKHLKTMEIEKTKKTLEKDTDSSVSTLAL